MYGLLMLAYDHCAVSPLDFSTRIQTMRDTMDTERLSALTLEDGSNAADALNAALDTAEAAAAEASKSGALANSEYAAALEAGDTEAAKAGFDQRPAPSTVRYWKLSAMRKTSSYA